MEFFLIHSKPTQGQVINLSIELKEFQGELKEFQGELTWDPILDLNLS